MSLADLHDQNERLIAEKLIDAALTANATVSVNDGEETTLRRSRDRAAILAAMATTDGDVIMITLPDMQRPIAVHLIYGNGTDLISDSTDSAVATAFLAPIQDYANQIAEAS
jgi:hypothetical protein